MDALPDEILQYIFCFLPIEKRLRLEAVCRRWQCIMPYHGLRSLDIVNVFHLEKSKKIDTLPVTSALRSLLKRCGYDVEKVSFGKLYLLITPITIDLIHRYCPNLKELDLSFCTVTESLIPALIPLSSQLEGLNFGNTSFSIRDVYTHRENLHILFSALTKLRHLNLQRTSVQNFSALPILSSSIRSVNLNSCAPLRSDVLTRFLINAGRNLEELRLSAYSNLDETLMDIICSIETLKILELSHLSFSDLLSHENLSGLDFSGLASLKRLESLSVQQNNAITDRVLRDVCASCSQLRLVNLAYDRSISDFTPLARLARLSAVYIAATERFTDSDLAALSSVGQLRVFHATNCARLGAGGLKALIGSDCADKLEQLSLVGQWESETVLDDLLTSLFAVCRKLQVLTLQGCPNLTDQLFDPPTHMFTLPPKLQSLDLSFCPLLTDRCVSLVSEACVKRVNWPNLTFYVHQSKVTRAALANVAPSLKIIL